MKFSRELNFSEAFKILASLLAYGSKNHENGTRTKHTVNTVNPVNQMRKYIFELSSFATL